MRILSVFLVTILALSTAQACPKLTSGGDAASSKIRGFLTGVSLLIDAEEANSTIEKCFYSFEVVISEIDFLKMYYHLRAVKDLDSDLEKVLRDRANDYGIVMSKDRYGYYPPVSRHKQYYIRREINDKFASLKDYYANLNLSELMLKLAKSYASTVDSQISFETLVNLTLPMKALHKDTFVLSVFSDLLSQGLMTESYMLELIQLLSVYGENPTDSNLKARDEMGRLWINRG